MSTPSSDKNPKNRDPISGEPGSHPVGTGLGAAAGGAAGVAAGAAAGAATGSVGGPVGAVAGLAVGAVAGGLAGKGIAEAVNPTEEDAYWRENHNRQWFASGRSYDDYQDAYRLGYEGYARYGAEGRSYDDVEENFQRDYETNYSRSGLSWEDARRATRAAWNRVAGNYHRLIGYHVEDTTGSSVGKIHNLWTDEMGQPVFLGVKTGWLFGKNHVVPVATAEVNDTRKVVRLPFTEDQIKNAPTFDETAEIADYDQDRIFTYYGVERPGAAAASTSSSVRQEQMVDTPSSRADVAEQRTVQLKEEQVKIGKREVEAGGIRLHKIVRIETVNQPIELKREEIVIERVPADRASTTGETRFEEEDIFIPLRREEPVVQKEARVREQVRVGKKTEVEQQQITEQVRKEDLQVDQNTTPRTRS